jgi:hypothetical protein
MRVRVHLTQNDIDTGIRRNCRRCPAALAIRRKLKPGIMAMVTDDFAWLKLRGIDLDPTIPIPSRVANFIHAFDDLKRGQSRSKLKPFSFVVNIPKEYLDVG